MTARKKRRARVLLAALGGLLLPAVCRAQTDWTMFAFDNQMSGYNPNETVLSTSTVHNLKLLWQANLGAASLTQPLVLGQVTVGSSTLDLVYVATLAGEVYAINAATGAPVWSMATPVNSCPGLPGVIGTMTVVRSQNVLLVEAGDGTLHSFDIATGTEQTGYPIQLLDSANLPPTTLIYGATVDWPYLYAESASCNDQTPFHGQIVQVDLTMPAVVNRWYPNGSTGPNGGGIWGPGAVSIEPNMSAGTAPVYAAIGNAVPSSARTTTNSEHVVKLSGQLKLLASNLPQLPNGDKDFGATPLLYQAPGCPPQLAAMNKTGVLFIYNRNSIASGPFQSLAIANIPGGGGDFIGVPAFDPVHLMMYLGNPSDNGPFLHGLVALSVQSNCALALAWNFVIGRNSGLDGNAMIPPVVANGVVYYSKGITKGVVAVDAVTGKELWGTGKLLTGPADSPTVVNGHVYIATRSGVLYAFGL